MIINIPITIDEEAFEIQTSADLQNRVIKEIANRVQQALIKRAYHNMWRASDDAIANNGLLLIVEDQVKAYIEKMQDQVIDTAAKELAARLMKTKKGKEILNTIEADMRGVDND